MSDEIVVTDTTHALDAPQTIPTLEVETKPEPKTFTEDYVKQLRAENAKQRVTLKTFEDAQLTESQKMTQRVEDADKTITSLNERVIKSEVKLAANAANLVDPEAVYALLDKSKIERDPDTGEATNIDKLIADLAKNKPYLVKQESVAPQSGGNIANPARPRAHTPFTRAMLADPDFYAANEKAIIAAMRAGEIAD